MKLPISKKEYAYATIKEHILTGKYPYLYKFPPEPETAEELDISRGTLREAFSRLKKENLISSIQKNGTFVIYDKAPKCSARKILQLFEPQSGIESPYNYLVTGIRAKASELNIEIVDCETEFFFSNMSSAERKKLICNNAISSVIFTPYKTIMTSEVISILDSLDVPIVVYGQNQNLTGNFVSICTEYKNAWESAIKHLCELGHRKIVSVLNKYLPGRGLKNLEEHRTMLRMCGASDDKSLILELDYDKQLIKESVKKVLTGTGTLPTAVLCVSDFYAIQVYEAIHDLSLTIPKDISVMGFCGYPGSAFLSPALSTIDIDYRSKGMAMLEAAANTDWINKENLKPITVDYKLIARESTAKHSNHEGQQ